MSEDLSTLTAAQLLGRERYKRGVVKCRLIHMDGRSVVQPDLLLSTDREGKKFFVPKFFDPNHIAFFESDDDSFCHFTIVVPDAVVLRVLFFARDRVKTCADGSVLYRCRFARLEGKAAPKPCGVWREQNGKFQLKLFHHTNDVGYRGISASRQIWGSRRNIQGNLWLNNIAYGYFTSVRRIQTEQDLEAIAMSSSGLTGFVPTNAPFHPVYASMIRVPQQKAADRARTLALWVDCELLAPNHLWMHRPAGRAAYYEIVLPKVFRVGVLPGTNLQIVAGQVHVEEGGRRIFEYVIVGDADLHSGLQAPFREEETAEVAVVEQLRGAQEIIECWRRLANTNRFDGRVLEYAELLPEPSAG